MRAKNEVSAALMGPTPCDKCIHRANCGTKKLACIDFHRWVNNGVLRQESREPTHKIYRLIFRGERAA